MGSSHSTSSRKKPAEKRVSATASPSNESETNDAVAALRENQGHGPHDADYVFHWLPEDIGTLEEGFRSDPTVIISGQLNISDVLLRVFAYIEPHRATMLAVSRVNRQWCFYSEFLPQWIIFDGAFRSPDALKRMSQNSLSTWLMRMVQGNSVAACNTLVRAGAKVRDSDFKRLPADFLQVLSDEAKPNFEMVLCTNLARRVTGDVGCVQCVCPDPASNRRTVWGNGPYTNDSDMCKAAAHAGAGRMFSLKFLGNLPSYTGDTRNGVTTVNYGPFDAVALTPTHAFVAPAMLLASLSPCPLSSQQLGILLERSVEGNMAKATDWILARAEVQKIQLSDTMLDKVVRDWNAGQIKQHLATGVQGPIRLLRLLTPEHRGQFIMALFLRDNLSAESPSGAFLNVASALEYGAPATFDADQVRRHFFPLLPFFQKNIRLAKSAISCTKRGYGRITAGFWKCDCKKTNFSTVWGSNPYTDDSDLCGVAQHAGVPRGSVFQVANTQRRSSYSGSDAHGVRSLNYGAFNGFDLIPSGGVSTEDDAKSFFISHMVRFLSPALRAEAFAHLCHSPNPSPEAVSGLLQIGPLPFAAAALAAPILGDTLFCFSEDSSLNSATAKRSSPNESEDDDDDW